MRQKLFLDTNIMLDLLGEREPFYKPIAKIASLISQEEIQLVASGLSFATVNYLLCKLESAKKVKEKLRKFKIIVEISGIDDSIVEKALNSDFKDFEDALQYFSALKSNCNVLLTRNPKDFKKSKIPVMSATEFLNAIGKK